jgi:hypothetical protein
MTLLRDRRRKVLAAEARVANELEQNAAIVERHARGYMTRQEITPHLRFNAWEDEEARLHTVNQVEAGLWDEIAAVYNALRTASLGGDQPEPGAMRELADRLRSAGY